jgi:polyribonucleotide nucleotidyltransferase
MCLPRVSSCRPARMMTLDFLHHASRENLPTRDDDETVSIMALTMVPPILPEIGSIQRGRVVRIEPYAAFVQLDDYRLRGFVHVSKLVS